MVDHRINLALIRREILLNADRFNLFEAFAVRILDRSTVESEITTRDVRMYEPINFDDC